MSYSSEAKEELCRVVPESICCHLAELSGIVSAAGSVLLRGGGGRRLFVETENESVAGRCMSLMRDVFDVQPALVTRTQTRLGGRKLYRVVLDGEGAALRENEDVKEFYLGVSGGDRRSFKQVKHYRRRKRWLA